MSGFQEFISQLKRAGVTIEGEVLLAARAAAAEDWTAEVATLALGGREKGIRLIRAGMDCPSNQQLDAIVRRYAFTDKARRDVVENVVAAPADQDMSAKKIGLVAGRFVQDAMASGLVWDEVVAAFGLATNALACAAAKADDGSELDCLAHARKRFDEAVGQKVQVIFVRSDTSRLGDYSEADAQAMLSNCNVRILGIH